MIKEIFKLKSANTKKLKDYGFTEKDNSFEYETTILHEQFTLFVYIKKDGEIMFFI